MTGTMCRSLPRVRVFEVLDLDHERELVAHVEVVQLEVALVLLAVTLDDVDIGIGGGLVLHLLVELVEFVEGADRHPEVVEARARHRIVLGGEEHELLVGVHPHHESTTVLREHVVLLPTEHVAVERGDVLAPFGTERVGRHRHGDVVETRQARFAHDDSPGAMRTLAAIWPPARPCIASSAPASGTSVGSMSASSGNFPDASSARDRWNPSSS